MFKSILIIPVILLFIGCSGPQSAQIKNPTDNNPGGNGSGLGGGSGIGNDGGGNSDILDLNYSASLKNGQNVFSSGQQVLQFSKDKQALIMTIPLPFFVFLDPTSFKLPQSDKITVEVTQDAIKLTIPIKNYVDLLNDPTKLPNGRPLPGYANGEPPIYAFPLNISDLKAYGYADFESFSIFIETPALNIPIAVPLVFPFPLYSSNNEQLGTLYWLGYDKYNNYDSGIFLTFGLPPELTAFLAGLE